MPDFPSPQRPEQERGRSQLARFSGVGIQMLVTIGLCTWAGVWLDGKMGWSPWATVVLTLLGVFSAMYQVIKAVSQDK